MPALQRLDTRYGVSLRADCVARDTFVAHVVTNICRGGLFLEGTSLPIDSELQLRLHLDEHDILPVRARVVWNYESTKTPRHARGMGMKFVDLSGEELRRFESFLKQLGVQQATAPPTHH